MDNDQNFEVVLSSVVNNSDGDTEVATIVPIDYSSKIEEFDNKLLYSAVQKYDSNKQIYGAYTSDNADSTELTLDRLQELARGIHNNLDSVIAVNAYIREALVINQLVGKTFESLFANVNTGYRLYWPEQGGRNKHKTVLRAKEIIDDFLKQICVEEFIRDAVSITYLEGNRYYYLRQDGGNWMIDRLPLGLCYCSDYIVNGEPSLAINVKELETRLKKTYSKTKKRKAIWFDDVKADIQNNYPYVFDAYRNGESIARLDTKYAKACRYNNIGRKYGVSPLMKILPDVIVLNNIRKADVTTSKMKQRVIIAQILRAEILGPEGKRKGVTEAIYSHQQLMSALKTAASVYTAPAFVEKLMYVQPEVEDTSDNKLKQYNNNLMIGLGIGYIDPTTSTVAGAKLALDDLMKTVNAIADGAQKVLNEYFKVVLEENGIGPEYAPTIDVLNSEALALAMRKELASFIFGTLNGSYRTAYELVGLDYDTEYNRRESENNDETADVFSPHATAYTSGGTNTNTTNGKVIDENTGAPRGIGRPKDTNPSDETKQARDREANNTV